MVAERLVFLQNFISFHIIYDKKTEVDRPFLYLHGGAENFSAQQLALIKNIQKILIGQLLGCRNQLNKFSAPSSRECLDKIIYR